MSIRDAIIYKYSHGGNAVFEGLAGNMDTADTVDTVNTADTADTVNTADTADTVDSVDSVDTVDTIDLSANMNPLGMPDNVMEAIVREIQHCEHYPDNFSYNLRRKIAGFENVKPQSIFCSNGASDIIFRLPKAVRSKKVMVTAPTFSDYERAAISAGAQIVRYKLAAENGFALNCGFVECVRREKPDLVYICNPNNPTGKLAAPILMKDLLDCSREINAWVAVDECFIDFVRDASEYTSKVYLGEYNKLVIIKAFTKIFALPGIRLGYAICADESLVDRLHFHGADWPVSSLAQAAGVAALDGAEEYIKRTIGYVTSERTIIENRLALLGYKVFDAAANYVFIQNPYENDLGKALDSKGIRIRSCANYHGLDESYYRIAVSTKENNSRLIEAIAEVTKPYVNAPAQLSQSQK